MSLDDAWVLPGSRIHPSAKLGRCMVSHDVTIERDAVIEDGAILNPLTYVGEGTRIGRDTVTEGNCYIGKGVRVGADCVVVRGAKIEDFAVLRGNNVIGANAHVGPLAVLYVGQVIAKDEEFLPFGTMVPD